MWNNFRTEERKHVPFLKILFLESEKRNVFIYILIFATWTLIELFYGLWINSIVLIANAFLSVFGCLGMIVNLVSIILSRRPPTARFTYGFDRVETIGIFSNGAMLVFVCLFIFFQSFERFLHQEGSSHNEDGNQGGENNDHHQQSHPDMSHADHFREYHINRTIGIAVIGLIINAVGFIYFKKHVHMRSESRHLEKQELSRSMYKLLSAHSLSTAAVVFASFFSAEYPQIDSIVSFFIGIIIIKIVLPLCIDTGRVLLQATPISIKERVDRAIVEVNRMKDVVEVIDHHFWTQSSGIFVGSLIVRVTQSANEDQVLNFVSSLFPMITHLTVQIEKENLFEEDEP